MIFAAVEDATINTGPEAFFGQMGVTCALIFASPYNSFSKFLTKLL